MAQLRKKSDHGGEPGAETKAEYDIVLTPVDLSELIAGRPVVLTVVIAPNQAIHARNVFTLYMEDEPKAAPVAAPETQAP